MKRIKSWFWKPQTENRSQIYSMPVGSGFRDVFRLPDRYSGHLEQPWLARTGYSLGVAMVRHLADYDGILFIPFCTPPRRTKVVQSI